MVGIGPFTGYLSVMTSPSDKVRITMKPKLYILSLFVLLLVALAACAPRSRAPASATPAVPVPATVIATAVIPEETAVPPTHTALPPTATATPAPVTLQPALITHDHTNVRLGPGLAYGVSFVLPANTTAPIIGKSLDSTWWAVPGNGQGSYGWVSGAVVSLQGSLNGVPFLAAPTLTPTPNLPTVGNEGLPPGGDTCVVVQPGPNDVGPTVLRQGPGHSFPVVAILGLNRWADIAEVQSGWYRVQDASGLGGWIHESEAAFAGRCSAPGSGPDLPIIEDPGSPPANRCSVSRPGQFPPPGIHLGPGRQFALIARLGNWAEILQTEMGWHQILLGPGQVGWVSDEDVDLIGACQVDNNPAPQRIEFAPGTISAIVDGQLQPPQRNAYVFRSLAGQMVILEIHSTDGRANFMLQGVSDGQPYKRLEDEQRLWSARLPLTQDYLLTVAAPADAPATEYSLELIIEPLEGGSGT